MPGLSGRGQRPCHSTTLILDQQGATAPGQRPPRPRRALATVVPGPAGPQGTVAQGRGKRGSRFLLPPDQAKALSPLPWRGPTPLPQHHADPWPAGGQSPRPAPAPLPAGASPPPGRALASVFPGPAGLQGTVPRGRGKRGSRFLIPPGGGKVLPMPKWQGPSPLPRCHAGVRTSRGPKPPASARPAPGGRFSPAGPGAGLCWFRTCRSAGDRPARAGKRGSRFLIPPEQAKAPSPLHWQGPSPQPQRRAGISTSRVPKAPGQRPPGMANPFPGWRHSSRPAGGLDACSAPRPWPCGTDPSRP